MGSLGKDLGTTYPERSKPDPATGQLISILGECVPLPVCVCVCDDCNRNANRFRNVLRPSVRGDVTTLRSQ